VNETYKTVLYSRRSTQLKFQEKKTGKKKTATVINKSPVSQ